MFSKFNIDNKIILKNFSFLSLMKFFNLGFKFLLIGYLIRVLEKDNYGLVTWLDSIIQYFIMIINFGFNIYVAKYIVELNNNKQKLNEVVSSVYYIKSILLIFSIIVVIGLSFYQDIKPYQNIFVLLIFTGVGEVLFPIWFFQGKENLKPATVIVFISRLLMIILVVLFVKDKNDIDTYIYALIISSFFMGFSGIYYLMRHYEFSFIKVPVKKLIFFFKESLPFFLGRFLSLVFNAGTIFLIGKFCSYEQVAGFDFSLKVVMVGVIPFDMLQQAVFPTISRTKNKKLLKKLIISSFLIGLVLAFFIIMFSENLMLLFGGETMMEFVPILKFLSLLLPFVALTFVLGSCSLVAFGYFKEYNFSLIFTSIIYILIIIIMYSIDEINFWNLVYLRVFGDVVMLLIRLYFSIKRKVLIL